MLGMKKVTAAFLMLVIIQPIIAGCFGEELEECSTIGKIFPIDYLQLWGKKFFSRRESLKWL